MLTTYCANSCATCVVGLASIDELSSKDIIFMVYHFILIVEECALIEVNMLKIRKQHGMWCVSTTWIRGWSIQKAIILVVILTRHLDACNCMRLNVIFLLTKIHMFLSKFDIDIMRMSRDVISLVYCIIQIAC
jgi:predicted unusual protein kinase regulating ubiquinone biosynthesis (AarF/ABC1/UbiB family)